MSMTSILTWIKAAAGAACSAITALFGGMDALLGALLIFITIDYITGLIDAIYAKTVSSAVGFKGILKKLAILAVVAVAHEIGVITGVGEIRSFVIGFYIANEGISILENAGKVGVPMPKKLLDVLEQLKKDDTEE